MRICVVTPFPDSRRIAINRGNYAKHAAIWGLGEPGRAGEIEFYSTLARKYGNKVLSLMCATGEIASGMAKNGFHVTAIDIEPAMIAVAKKNNTEVNNPRFHTGDVTSLHLPDKDYDFAFIGTGDFHHLLLESEMLAALAGIREHLKVKGGLALELIPAGDKSWHSPEHRFQLTNTQDTELNAWKIAETSYDSGTMRLHIKQDIFTEKHGKTENFLHEFYLQLMSAETLGGLLQKNGFTVTNQYGGFDFSGWRPGADKWIIEAVKVF